MSFGASAIGRDGGVVPAREGHFQPEIQGMRALAVVAVIGAHAGLPGLQGGFIGVDVFFVISGFLITRLLAAEMAATGRIDLLAFWARRARRLLPNAYATLIGTALLALFMLPAYNLGTLAREIAFAALEVVNFYFADKAVDYFQSDAPASPILHFWSLAVEEQFYTIWPVLLVGLGLTVRHRFLRAATLLLGVIWCASLAASIVLTQSDQPLAYFGTGTRLWQLATGALLAVGWQRVERVPGLLRTGLAWLGLAVIVTGMILVDDTRRYPGFWALLPTLGAAALIAGFGAAHPQGALRRGLSLPVLQWLGARSYSWYLWHWPLLAIPRVAFPDSAHIEIIAVPLSLVIAMAAYRWIEKPLRHLRFTGAGLLPTFAGAAAGLALVIGTGFLYKPALLLLDPAARLRLAQLSAAAKDRSQPNKDKCHLRAKQVKQPDCLYGDRAASRTAVLFGDSHAAQWFAPIDAAAKKTGWQLRSWTKSACPSAAGLALYDHGSPFTACREWNEAVMARLTGPDRPGLVIMSNSVHYPRSVSKSAAGAPIGEGERLVRAAFRKTIERLLAAGVEVVVIRDNPVAGPAYRQCFSGGHECATPRKVALASPDLGAEVARELGGRARVFDLTDEICNSTHCPITHNGALMYRDGTHLTSSYAATFAPQMERLLKGIEGLPPAQLVADSDGPAMPGAPLASSSEQVLPMSARQ